MVVDSRPNKRLGQHWLTDNETLSNIVAAADISAADTVLEVGPGLGTLTQALLATGASLTAVEYDAALATQLMKNIHEPNVQVIEHDILTFDFRSLPKDYKVVANIPYYLTSKLVRIVCESANPPKTTVLLVQKEVAQRIAAQPGAMSLLSISAQVYNTTTLGVVVPAALFTPPPKVDSQVIIMQRRPLPLVPHSLQKTFFRVVKAGFNERRKKLRSSLSGGLHLEKQQVDELLASVSINASARAQELSIDDWVRLTKKYITTQ